MIHTLLKRKATEMEKKVFNATWLQRNEGTTYKKIICCKKTTEFKTFSFLLHERSVFLNWLVHVAEQNSFHFSVSDLFKFFKMQKSYGGGWREVLWSHSKKGKPARVML